MNIDGTDQSEPIDGTAEDDSIEAFKGNDTVHGGAGNDFVHGGQGNDAIYGEDGDDSLVDAYSGEASSDENDTIFGGAGNDRLTSYQAGHFNDVDDLRGEDGDDTVEFNGAQTGDLADGGPGIDLFSGSIGASGKSVRLIFSEIGFTVFLEEAATVKASNFESLSFISGSGDDVLAGSGRADTVISTGGADSIQGLGGDDTLGLISRSGGTLALADGLAIDGGPGEDTFQIIGDVAAASYVFDLPAGDFRRDGVKLNLLGFEKFDLSLRTTGSVKAVGGALADSIQKTGSGSDTILGGAGNDTLLALFAPDATGQGTKLIDAGPGDDHVKLGSGGDSSADGGAGLDTLHIDESSVLWERAADKPQLIETSGAGTITPTGFELFAFLDNIVFTAAEFGFGGGIAGGTGDDSLGGSGADDIISGLAGNDTLEGGAGIDFLAGGDGIDLVSAAGATTLVFVDLQTTRPQYFYDGTSFDRITNVEGAIGGAAGDFLLGDREANLFRGGGGADAILGGDDRDTIEGGDGDDLLMSGRTYDPTEFDTGSDRLDGGGGSDLIFGQNGGDSIHGGEGADYVLAGAGADTVDGGAGDDFLFGGTEFVFNEANAGLDSMAGGDGVDFIAGGEAANKLNGDGGDDLVYGGAGDDAINNTGADLGTAGAGNDTLFGDAGRDTIAGGSGFDYIYGGADADTFVFRLGDSFDSVFDWSIAEGDSLQLDPAFGVAGFGDFRSRLAGFTFEGADYTVIAFATTVAGVTQFDQLTVKGIQPAQWTAAMLV